MATVNRTYPHSVQPGIPKLSKLKAGWLRLTIGELFDEVRRPVNLEDSQRYNLVTVKRSRGGVIRRDALLGSEIAVKSQFRVEEGDFLISKRQIVHGACGIVPADLAGSIVSNEYSVLRPRQRIDVRFLTYFTHTVYFQQTCFHSSIGVHVEKMIFKLEDWFKWKIDIPNLDEQQRISNILGAFDARLSLLENKQAYLSDYKKGLIQRVFSKALRFRDDNGDDFPDWKDARLSEVVDIVGGGTPDSLVPEYWNGDVVWFTPSEIKSKYLSDSERHITAEGLKASSAQLLPQGTLVLSTRATVGEVGIATKPCSTNQGFQSLVVREPNSNEFWYYWIHANKLEFLRRAAGSTFLEISKAEVGKIRAKVPVPREQEKISNFLASID